MLLALAQVLRAQKKPDEAVAQLERLANAYPKSLLRAHALYQRAEIAQEQYKVLEKWLGLLRERDWLVQNRRRTQRVMLRFPVRVSGQNAVGSPFEEETHTLAVNANGALVLLSVSARKGQLLRLLNTATGGNAECVVAYLGQRKGDLWEVGVAFSMPNPTFWQVAFPPSNWTPPAPGGV